jgi:hypothetical protein
MTVIHPISDRWEATRQSKYFLRHARSFKREARRETLKSLKADNRRLRRALKAILEIAGGEK